MFAKAELLKLQKRGQFPDEPVGIKVGGEKKSRLFLIDKTIVKDKTYIRVSVR